MFPSSHVSQAGHVRPDLQHLEASSIQEAHTEQQMVPRALRVTGVKGQRCAHASGSCFQEPLLPQVWGSKRVTANGGQQLEGGAAPHRRQALCWPRVERLTGFQMDFLSFIFLSKGLITSCSPACMGIMSLFSPDQYNAQ